MHNLVHICDLALQNVQNIRITYPGVYENPGELIIGFMADEAFDRCICKRDGGPYCSSMAGAVQCQRVQSGKNIP